ncbi:hypothetical protein GUITHDRAFT_140463 [Guillardia theta CCMP2712]|uniref:Uncharacterized protein n=1 Tax=Guillardia theta (strain CCMP2712) TaxID=905079 RepID=L1J516_GUITC|nr:hypothetical protein GUITHDRAFT_140463 [Guillardia theta CCMP2712]EKX43412.1 hypothetical protein GUITHDRAFT_140463 [Guillardia theta CCMP2712]|eukprot:XP_005830392.1 hypothetical protein GUITHDRAFT_140463 [Guillardia theta CCMP2712]
MGASWYSALAAVSLTLLLLLTAISWSPPPSRSALRSTPKMVRQLEQEARRNVENDATVAGLKALDDKDSLAATLTGGLKRKLENMQAGDDLMLKNIEKEASQPDKVARKEKQERKQEAEEGGKATKGQASIKLPNVDIDDVIAVIRRDRKRQMQALAISLARVSLLRKKELAPDSLLKLTSSDRPRGGANRRSQAKKLLEKAAELKAKAESIRRKAIAKEWPKSSNFESAMDKQKKILNKLKKAHATGSKMSSKEMTKLQKKSEDLTEKAVHTMLESRRLSHKGTDDLRAARAVESRLPALQVKAQQAKLVLNVLKSQEQQAIARLKNFPAYNAAMRLSKKLTGEAAKDKRLAKELLAEKSSEKKTGSGEKEKAARDIRADKQAFKELNILRHKIDKEKASGQTRLTSC